MTGGKVTVRGCQQGRLVTAISTLHRMGARFDITDKTGKVVAIKPVVPGDELMVITRNGIVNRQSVDGIRVIGRNTQGVRLINLDSGDMVMDVACLLDGPVPGHLTVRRRIDATQVQPPADRVQALCIVGQHRIRRRPEHRTAARLQALCGQEVEGL